MQKVGSASASEEGDAKAAAVGQSLRARGESRRFLGGHLSGGEKEPKRGGPAMASDWLSAAAKDGVAIHYMYAAAARGRRENSAETRPIRQAIRDTVKSGKLLLVSGGGQCEPLVVLSVLLSCPRSLDARLFASPFTRPPARCAFFLCVTEGTNTETRGKKSMIHTRYPRGLRVARIEL